MKQVENKHIKLRILIVGFTLCIFFLIVGARAVHLQVFCGNWLSKKAAAQYVKSFKLHGKRGTIYDIRHGELAVSINVTSIAAYPPFIKDKKFAADALSKTLKLDKNTLCRKFASKKSFVWIKRQVTPKQAEAVAKFNIKGIDFIPEYCRFYPNKTLAAQVIGFTGLDGHGLEGIEFFYDSYLKGDKGRSTILKDALGGVFDAGSKTAASYSGKNLVLTIDRTIQYITEKALEETVLSFSAKSGMAVVMVPETGAVLAMAHFPFFNPNSFKEYNRKIWRNRIITDQFEPGSIMKIFSAAAAIESGGCLPNSIFFCENGAYKIGKNIIHDTSPHGWLSLQNIIKCSSNIGMVKIIEMIGHESLFTALHDFGFGLKTGIDCPGETSGSLSNFKRWSEIDAGTISFGQGISVSATQLITSVSSIANGGMLMSPYIVQAITDQNGRVIHSFGPRQIRRVISSETASSIKKIMQSVISSEGTGAKAALKGYSACGKTGTAQKIDEKGTYAKGKYIASFIGFIPAGKPEMAVLVIVDEPEKNHYGGVVSAPAFKRIAHETLNYLNVPPDSKTDNFTVSREKGVKG